MKWKIAATQSRKKTDIVAVIRSGAILARSIDRRAAEQMGGMMTESNRVTNAAEVRRLVRFWGRRLREGLDGFGQ